MTAEFIVTVAVFAILLGIILLRLTRAIERLPASLRLQLIREREAATTELQEAVASRAGGALIVLSTYQERLIEQMRSEVAGSELRARVAERRALEVSAACKSALAEMSALLDAARTEHSPTFNMPAPAALPEAPKSMTRPRADVPKATVETDFDDDEERTKVGGRQAHVGMLPPAPGAG